MGRLTPAIGFLFLIVAVALVFGALSSPSTPTKRSESILAPYLASQSVNPVTIFDQNGKEMVLDGSLPDKTLITFWDASCGECQIGLPIISSFISAHPEITAKYINVKNTPDQASETLSKLGLSIETLYDPKGSAFAAWSGTMPATYFVRSGMFKVFFPGRVSPELLDALLTLE